MRVRTRATHMVVADARLATDTLVAEASADEAWRTLQAVGSACMHIVRMDRSRVMIVIAAFDLDIAKGVIAEGRWS